MGTRNSHDSGLGEFPSRLLEAATNFLWQASRSPEVSVALAMVAIVGTIKLVWHLPWTGPSSHELAVLGTKFMVALAIPAIWFAVSAAAVKRARALEGTDRLSMRAQCFLVAPICFLVVLLCHFEIKRWVPVMNPTVWDGPFMAVDHALAPLIHGCFALRSAVASVIPGMNEVYCLGFFFMFMVSFSVHAIFDPAGFRRVFLAILFTLALGSLSYLAFPAVGPFIYETGLNARETAVQSYMLEQHQHLLAVGKTGVGSIENFGILLSLAAMPSLHAGCCWVFIAYARRRLPWLAVFFAPLYGWILIEAVASRWHYVIDLPAGIALAAVCVWLSDRVFQEAPAMAPAAAPQPARPVRVPPQAAGQGQGLPGLGIPQRNPLRRLSHQTTVDV